MRRVVLPTLVVALVVGAAGLPLLPEVVAVAAPASVLPVVAYDFNADGFPDLATGAPHLTLEQTPDAGGVLVYPSSSDGPVDRPQLLSRATEGPLGAPVSGDAFGAALASADFDHDGYADLAVGQPGRDLPQGRDGGAVTVFYGSAAGLDGSRLIDLPIPKGHRTGARFGSALAAADLDGDGYSDLAIGAPGDDVQRNPGHTWAASGTVRVFSGGKHGLSKSRYDKRHGKRGTGGSGFDVGFGAVLAAGDISVDGIADLVVGAPGHTYVGTHGYGGWIDVCRGGRGDVGTCRRPSMLHAKAYAGNWAGMTSLAIGRLWRHTPDIETPQIVIGSPQYADDQPGIVWIVTLGRSTRSVTDLTSFRQGSPAQIPGAGQPGSVHHRFGQSVAVGTFRNTSLPLLAIGAPGTDGAQGAVTTILLESDDQGQYFYTTYTQQTPGVPGGAANGHEFGASVAFADHDAGGDPELDVGAPGAADDTGSLVRLSLTASFHLTGGQLLRPGPPLLASAAGARFGETTGGS